MVVAYHCPHCNWTFENLQVFVRPKEHTERNADYEQDNSTGIIDNVMYLDKILIKSNIVNTSNINIF